jgi:hypothetical protein
MRRYAIAACTVVALAAGCGKKEHSPGSKPTTTGPVTVKEPKLERDVPEMGSAYKEAYEEAKRDINKDNAEDKLDELEHDVNKGL